MKNLVACKVHGICTRDKLVSEWVELRIQSNNLIRLATVEKVRQNWGLDCPINCEGEK